MLCIGFPIGFVLMLFRKKALRLPSKRGGAGTMRLSKRERRVITTCGCIAYCPGCRDPLNDQATWVEDGEGRGVYGCTKCGRQSEWHFGIAPGPVLLKPEIAKSG